MKFPTHSWSAADPCSGTLSKTVWPGDDFHRQVNEGWLKTAKIPQGLPAIAAGMGMLMGADTHSDVARAMGFTWTARRKTRSSSSDGARIAANRPAAAVFSQETASPPAGSRVRMFPRPQSAGGASMDLWVIGVVLALGAATYGLYRLVDALRSAP